MSDQYANQQLSFKEAQSSPCMDCQVSCCRYLPLQDFQITTFAQLDYAFYLCNFANIELALVDGQTWRAHYRAQCSRLDESNRCTLHNTPQKPKVCQRYNGYTCFYKPMFECSESDRFIRFDRARLEAFANLLTFDGHRNIVGYPDIVTLRQSLPVFHEVKKDPIVLTIEPSSNPSLRFSDFQNPCQKCKGWCCVNLSFPFSGIHNVGNLDYVWFCLGFPNVEIGISQEGWTVVIQTSCQFFNPTLPEGQFCSVFGTDQRPLQCEMYDASACAYKAQFSTQFPKNYLRVTTAQFHQLASLYCFDEHAQLRHAPNFEELQSLLRS